MSISPTAERGLRLIGERLFKKFYSRCLLCGLTNYLLPITNQKTVYKAARITGSYKSRDYCVFSQNKKNVPILFFTPFPATFLLIGITYYYLTSFKRDQFTLLSLYLGAGAYLC